MAGIHFESTLDNSDLKKKLREINQGIRDSGKTAEEQSQKIKSSFKQVASAAAFIGAGWSMKEFMSEVTRVRGEFQKFEAVLGNMFNDTDKVKDAMKMISDFAAYTPFQVNELTGSFVKLVGTGFTPTITEMTKMGDLASSTGKGFDQLTEAILDAQTGENERLKEFGIRASKSGSKVTYTFKEQATTVENTASAIRAYILSLGDLQGVQGANAKISATLTGKISNLEDKITAMYNKIGTSTEGIISDAIDGASTLVDNYEEIGKILIEIAATYGVYKAVMISVNVLQKANSAILAQAAVEQKLVAMSGHKLSNAQAIAAAKTKLLTVAQKGLTKALKASAAAAVANPYVLIAAAIAGVSFAIYKAVTAESELERSSRRINEENKKLLNSQSERKQKSEELISTIQSEVETEYSKIKAYNELKSISPALTSAYDRETLATLDITNAKKLLNKESEKEYRLKKEQRLLDAIERNKTYTETVGGSITGGPGTVLTMTRTSQEIEELQEIKNLRRDLANDEKIRQEAIWDAQPKEVKIVSLKANIKSLQKEYDELESAVNKELVSNGGFSANSWLLELKGKEIKEKKTELQTIDPPAETKVQDKAFWTKEKESAEIILDELDKTTIKTEEGADKYKAAQKKLAEAINELKWYDRSEAKVNAKDDPIKLLDQLTSKELSAQEKINATRIALMKDGADKQKAYAEATHKKEIDRINAEEQEKLSLYNDYLKNGGQPIENQKESIKRDAVVQRSQADDLKSIDIKKIDQKTADEINEIVKNEKKVLQDLLQQYQTYADERIDIEKKFNDDIAVLQSKNIDGSLDSNIGEAENQKKQALKAVTDAEFESLQNGSNVIASVFADTSNKSIADITKIRDEASELIEYLATTESKDIVAGFGMSAEDLKTLDSSPEKIKALNDGIKELYDAGVKKNPFAQVASDIEDLFKAGGEKDLEKKLSRLGTSASGSAEMIGGLSGGLSDMFAAAGNEKMAGVASGVEMAMTSVSNVASGFANGGIVGGIAAAAGELINFATMAFEAEARHQAALDEIAQTKIAHQKEYDALLIEQNLLYKQGSTIFGDNDYGKANNAIKVSKNLNSDLRKQLDALKDIDIVTGHKKTGLFGWGKGKDTYSGIFEVYDNLIDSEGNLNVVRAEAILATEKLSDEHKGLLEEAIDLNAQYEESVAMMNDYLSGIFGDLGNSMSDALVDAFKNGTDASKAFESSVGEMLENLAQQMIYSVTLAPIMEEAQKAMSTIMNNGGLTDDQKFSEYTGVLSGLMDDAIYQQDSVNKLYAIYQEMAANKGINIFKPDAEENHQLSTSGKGFQTMSQDTGDELNGRFTAIQILNEEMRNIMQLTYSKLIGIDLILLESTNTLGEIRNLTVLSVSYLDDISKNTKDLSIIKEYMKDIKNNTSKL